MNYWETRPPTTKQLSRISDVIDVSIDVLKRVILNSSDASHLVGMLGQYPSENDISKVRLIIDERLNASSYSMSRKDAKIIKDYSFDLERDRKLPFEEKLKKIPVYVKKIIFNPYEKKTIDEFNIKFEGDESEKQFKDRPIWNSKTQIDELITKDLDFSEDEIKSQYLYDIGKNNTTKIYRKVEAVIRDLRATKTITDWNKDKGGVWRLTYSDMIPNNEPSFITDNENKIENKMSEIEFSELPENNKLPNLTEDEIDEGYNVISHEILIKKQTIVQIINALVSNRHVILTGPIGTGKTHLAKRIPEVFWKNYGGYISEEYTATSDWSVQDVIGGIFPIMNGNDIGYTFLNGCVLETLHKDQEQKKTHHIEGDKVPRGVWLTIDEFNRAEIDKAFGQLFTGLRTREIKVFFNKQEETFSRIKIPKDFRIIGTMNTTDKTFLFKLSDALKSRFAFIEIDIPEYRNQSREMTLAFQSAIDDLQITPNEIGISLFGEEQIFDVKTSDPRFLNQLKIAHEIISLIRIYKKLGTSILKTMYQQMLVSFNRMEINKLNIDEIDKNFNNILDDVILTTIIPQLENLDSRSDLEIIEAMFQNKLPEYIRNSQRDNINRESILKSISKLMRFLNLNEKEIEKFINDFESGKLVSEIFESKLSGKNEFSQMKVPESLIAIAAMKENMMI